MAILSSCCCWKSLKTGSYASAIYTLVYNTIWMVATVYHISIVSKPPAFFFLCLLLLAFFGLCIVSSVMLIVGLYVDNRVLLIPWLVIVSMTTLLDIALSLYLLSNLNISPSAVLLCVIDYITCSVSIYCLLCVFSQYQEYLSGRGHCQANQGASIPVVLHNGSMYENKTTYIPPDCQKSSHNGVQSVTLSRVVITSTDTSGASQPGTERSVVSDSDGQSGELLPSPVHETVHVDAVHVEVICGSPKRFLNKMKQVHFRPPPEDAVETEPLFYQNTVDETPTQVSSGNTQTVDSSTNTL